jgi:hypothetical protein
MHTLLFVLFHLVFAGGSPNGHPAKENKFVKVDVTLANATLQPGGKGTILVSFSPIDGIHINVDPPITVKIEKNQFIALEGGPDVNTDKEIGFLSTSTPVEQHFNVSGKARSGEQTITGTIVYYFCSDTEGWCRKLSQRITLKLNIQKK